MQALVSLEQLNDFAAQFWSYVGDARVFAFYGEMGAGKTTIITSLCHYKGVVDTIGSPTFSIINEYSFSANGKEEIIYHIDLYRLKDEDEIERAGVEDCIYSGSICMVEWAEKAPHLFTENTIAVHIDAMNNTQRTVKIDLPAKSMEEQS